ncbi:hypothetical protein BGZ95_009446, partial [Linnemannia exigua]
SSRYDVESEPVLFLGGMPVVVAPRVPSTTATAPVAGTASSTRRQERDSTASAPNQDNGHEMNDS